MDERQAIVHEFDLSGLGGLVIVGLYDDGRPAELFLKLAKSGSTLRGLCDAWASQVSMRLQYGHSLSAVFDKHVGVRFEPMAYNATSVLDYVSRWVLERFKE